MSFAQKNIMITADDYGVHSIINKGIEACVDADTLDCVAMIVTHKNSEHYIRDFVNRYRTKIKSGKLKIGLHLNLACGSPAYQDDYDFLKAIAKKNTKHEPVSGWYFKYNSPASITSRIIILGKQFPNQIYKEIEAQCSLFKEYTGKIPDHLSSHAGVFQATKEFYTVFAQFAIDHDILFRNPTLISFDDEVGLDWQNNPKQALFPWLINVTTNGVCIRNWTKNELKNEFLESVKNGLKSTDYFVEHFYQNPTEVDLRNILRKLGNKSYELVVHPVDFKHIKELKTLPKGINKQAKKMILRRVELNTLTQIKDQYGNVGLRNVLKNDFGFDVEIPSNDLVV